jgi:hypothetical protein
MTASSVFIPGLFGTISSPTVEIGNFPTAIAISHDGLFANMINTTIDHVIFDVSMLDLSIPLIPKYVTSNNVSDRPVSLILDLTV